MRKSHRVLIGFIATVGVAAVGVATVARSAEAKVAPKKTVKKTTTKTTTKAAPAVPKAGAACPTLNANAPGGLDCVLVGKALLWEPRGTQQNPFHIGDVGTFGPTAVLALTYNFRVVDPAKVLDPAEIGSPSRDRLPIPAGSVPVRIVTEMTNLGSVAGDPYANGAGFTLVDSAGALYSLYATNTCEQFGDGLADRLSLRSSPPGPTTGTLCAVVPSSQVNDKLVLKIDEAYATPKPRVIWFKTSL